MIEQCLSNKNKSTTISKSKNFLDLNKTLLYRTQPTWVGIGRALHLICPAASAWDLGRQREAPPPPPARLTVPQHVRLHVGEAWACRTTENEGSCLAAARDPCDVPIHPASRLPPAHPSIHPRKGTWRPNKSLAAAGGTVPRHPEARAPVHAPMSAWFIVPRWVRDKLF